MQANMRKSGLQNAEDELSRYINKNGEKGVISSVPLTASGSSSSSLATSGAKAVPVQSGTSSSALWGTPVPAEPTGTSSSGVNPTYQGNDFLQWYKKNFGTDYDTVANEGWSRPEGMADVDYEIGANLYNSYLSKRLLEDTYGSTKNELMGQYNDSLAALDTNKNTAMQQADVLRSRVEKYLPTQLKAQGLGGLGIGQQMQLDAYNDYVSDIGKINSEYNTNRTDLDSSHNSALAELEREYLENKTNLSVAAGEQSQNIFDKYLADYEAEQDELYAEAVNTILNSSYTTEEEMQAYIDKFRGKLSSENIASLQQYANGIAATNAENEQRELYDSALSAVMNSGYTTEQEILSFIDQFKGILSEKNISILKQYAKGLASQNLKEYRDDFADDSNVLLTDLLTYLNTEGVNYLNPDGSISESNYNKLLEYLTDYEDRLTDADKARLEAALEIYGRKITKEGEINTKSYVERVVAGETYSVQKEIGNLSEAGLDQIITDMRDTIIPSIASKAVEEFGDAGKYMAIMAAAPLAFEEKVASGEMSKEEYVLTLISLCATWGKAFDIKG